MGKLVALFLLALVAAGCGIFTAQVPTLTTAPLPDATLAQVPLTATPKPESKRVPKPRMTIYSRIMFVDAVPQSDWANLRAKPSTESTILAEVPDAARVRTADKAVRGKDGRFSYPVTYKSHKGYIASELLSAHRRPKPQSTPTPTHTPLPKATATLRPEPTQVPYTRTLYVDASPEFEGVNLRARPSIEANVLAELPNGTRVFAAGAPGKGYQGSVYYQVQYDGQRGFVRATMLRPDPYVAPTETPTPIPTDTPRPTNTPTPAPTATPSKPSPQGSLFRVTAVVDGDTIKIDWDGQITTLRLIGMDTPETKDPRKPVQCFGREASARAEELLSGGRVRIGEDPTQDTRDKYGRLLVYVYIQDGTLYNQKMIQDGYAHEYTYQVPYQLQRKFQAAERQAREQGRGFWSPSTCSGDTTQPADAPEPEVPGPVRDGNCDPSYPDFCIPPIEQAGDLDCKDVDGNNFTVRPPDPHGFDGNDDGTGCEDS